MTQNQAIQPPKTWQPCTKKTTSCRFWTWGEEALRPDCCTSHLQELLFFTEELLTAHGLVHWVDFGTLLGAVRQREMIPWDGDVDCSFLELDRDRVLSLRREINGAGFYLETRASSVLRIQYSKKNLLHLDLFGWWEEDGLMKFNFPVRPAESFFPAHYLTHLEPVTLYGRQFLAPSPVHEFLRAHRYGPGYMVPLRFSANRLPAPRPNGFWASLRQRVRMRQALQRFKRNLQLLHEVLATTDLSERYFVWGDLLLGWARDGQILPHNCHAADFGYFRADRQLWLQAIPSLVQAGFQPDSRWTNSAGTITEYVFTKDGTRFAFRELHQEGDTARYWVYALTSVKKAWLELVGVVPLRAFTHRRFLGRTWRIPDDHATLLTAVYGDWRTPNPYYDFVHDEKSIVKRTLWVGPGEPRVSLSPNEKNFAL